ncbi:hypothetical protein PQR37_30235 [Paraburkholderia nemoris]|uniref:hypothetical protein n=1 Tax=Paraburkholderia TaxID=1822464 RepID=UPI0038BB5F7F
MSAVLVIGLLKSMTQGFKAECARKGVEPLIVPAEYGNNGWALIPHPGSAVQAVQAYAEKTDDWRDLLVIVMPYAEVPPELDGELGALIGDGAKVIRAVNGQGGWPHVQKRKRADAPTIEQIRQRLWDEIPIGEAQPEDEVLPSEYFRQVCDANSRVIVAEAVYELCDLVEPLRRDFLKRAIEALTEFAREGSDGPIEAFFRARQLTHAQTGHNRSTLKLFFRGKEVLNETAETHLSQGNATTPQGAARLYYHHTLIEEERWVVITWAGPHPEGHFSRRCVCPETNR